MQGIEENFMKNYGGISVVSDLMSGSGTSKQEGELDAAKAAVKKYR